MQDYSQIEIQRVREESRHYQHKLRLKTIECRHLLVQAWVMALYAIGYPAMSQPVKGNLAAAGFAICAASAFIAYRAQKRARKEFGHAA